jgi:hypothetical protein
MLNQFVAVDDAGRSSRVCPHVAATPTRRWCWFTGVLTERAWVCEQCAQAYPTEPAWIEATPELQMQLDSHTSPSGFCGSPGVLVQESSSRWIHEQVSLELGASLIDLAPVAATPDRWSLVLSDATLLQRSLRNPTDERRWPKIDWGFALDDQSAIRCSRGARYVAVFEASGSLGAVFDTHENAVVWRLDRKSYHAENSFFPVAFVDLPREGEGGDSRRASSVADGARLEGRTLIVTATDWNRLDIVDLDARRIVTERTLASLDAAAQASDAIPQLDYFHGALSVSPRSKWIVDAGWHWHPWGADTAWSMDAWMRNPFESENGSTSRPLVDRASFWDGPVAWLDEDTIAVWGYGDDDENLIAAALIVSVSNQRLERWFAGPTIRRPVAYPPRNLKDTWVFDRWLFSISEEDGTCVWDVQSGARVSQQTTLRPWRYHPGAREFVTIGVGDAVLSRFEYEP